MKIFVIGGGKMGISHLALLTPYVGKQNVILIEKKLTVRLALIKLGYNCFKDVKKAVAKSGLPAGVIISTPTNYHAVYAKWAIEKKIPFFVEKPLTLNSKDSQDLVDKVNEVGLFAQVGFVMRYVLSFQKARYLFQSGKLGKLIEYTGSMQGNVIKFPPKTGNWQGIFSRGGGCLNEYGPHLIDLSQFMFGDIDRISSASYGQVYCLEADDWVDIEWCHDNNVTGKIKINWCNANKRKSVIEFVLEFELAVVRVDNSSVEIMWREDADQEFIEEVDAVVSLPLPNVNYYLRGEEFSLEIEDFLRNLRGEHNANLSELNARITPTLDTGQSVDRIIEEIAEKVGLQ